MPTVLLVDPALAAYTGVLRARLPQSVNLVATSSFDDAELERLAIDATILVNARRRLDAATWRLAPRVRFAQMIGAGYDTVDVEAAQAAGVVVAYNPGVNAVGTAEHTLLLILALLKHLPRSESLSRAGHFATVELISSGLDDLAGATVGLVGLGEIGLRVAERLAAFGCRLLYSTRTRRPEEMEARLGLTWVALPDLLRASTVVSLHLPLSPATYHLVGEAEMATMRAGSYLVNAARGGLVDEAALRRAIESGHLAGAGLDVLEQETTGVNPFADLPQVIVTPHVAGNSRRSLAGVAERTAANIERWLTGEPVRDLVPGLERG